jgi:hypothetical protein
MSENESQFRETLAKIAELASAVVNSGEQSDYGHEEDQESEEAPQGGELGCTLKSVPKRLVVKAAETAMRINPVNAPVFGPVAAVAAGLVMDPQRIAVLTGKYWGPTPRRLTVSFIDNTPTNLRNRIISHLNAWTRTGGIEFVYTQETGQVRISRGPGGYYSYLGTDILLIPRNRQTMNLEGFTMNTPKSEFERVIRHEAGHTLGFPHEHMRRALVERIDREKAYAYFRRTQGWDRATVDAQVLTPLDEWSIMATPADQDSIMCYQLPAEITRDGRPIRGGTDINQTDYDFCGRIYPKPGREQITEQEEAWREDDWEESQDPEVAAV